MIPPQFIIIPYQLLQDTSITPLDERVYGVIYWLTQLKGEKCIASNRILAEIAQTTPTTLQNSLTRLENKEYIIRKFKDKNKKNRQEIIPLVIFTKIKVSSTDDSKVSSHNDTVSSHNDTRVSSHNDQKKSSPIKKSSKEELLAIQYWNSHQKATGTVRNPLAKKKLLPNCRKTTPAIRQIWQKRKKEGYTIDDIKQAIDNYVREICSRSPGEYARHRFSFYEFIKQENGFIKFLNR